MGRAARSIQCYQVHSSNTLVTSSSEKTYKCKHIFWTMAWRIVCELLLLSKLVSLSVIPENRKLNAELSSVPEEPESQRTKRSSYYSDDYDQYVTEHECVNPDVIFSRGGERFKCVQQRMMYEVDVFDETGVLIPKPFFFNSGCEAKILR